MRFPAIASHLMRGALLGVLLALAPVQPTATAAGGAAAGPSSDSPRGTSCASGKRKAGTRRARAGKQGRQRRAAAAPVVIPVADPRLVAADPTAVARDFSGWLDVLATGEDVPGLAAAVVKDETILLERGIGYADAGSREAVDVHTVFRLASLSKAFAATMAGLLVERGQLAWDSKVSDLLPSFTLSDAAAARELTLAEVLSHRVGLPHNTYDRLLEGDEPYELLVGQLAEVPLACPVGQCYGYQNIAFSLVGELTYAVTGDFFPHQVETRLFHPLGMKDATFGRAALEEAASWARPHRRTAQGWQPFQPKDAYYRVAPAAGINASIHDMAQWLIAQMGGRPDVLSPALLATLHAPMVSTERELRSTAWRRSRLNEAHYALGWRVFDYAGATLVFHAGAVQGYRGMIAFLPAQRFGVVMLWNSDSALPAGLMPMLFDRYLGLPDANWADLAEPAPAAGKPSHG